MAGVQATILDLNGRRLGWSQTRRRRMKAVLGARKKSMLTMQECTSRMRKEIEADLGRSWNSIGHGKIVTFYNTERWVPTTIRRYDMRAPLTRRFLLIQFKHVTGKRLWVGNTHLSVHFRAARTYRRRQAEFMVAKTRGLRPLIVNGDINESSMTTGVRAVFARAGIKDAWAKAPRDRIHNRTANSHTGYRRTKYQSRRLDAMLSSKEVKVYEAGIYLTGRATDHNLLSEGIEF